MAQLCLTEQQIRENIRDRLAQARREGKFAGPTDLSKKVNAYLEEHPSPDQQGKKKKATISDQTSSNWMNARNIPGWDVLAALCAVIGASEEEILFGKKRGTQLDRERSWLVRANDEELRLLTAFRKAAKGMHKTILKQAEQVADDHPSPDAEVHAFRRKDDKR